MRRYYWRRPSLLEDTVFFCRHLHQISPLGPPLIQKLKNIFVEFSAPAKNGPTFSLKKISSREGPHIFGRGGQNHCSLLQLKRFWRFWNGFENFVEAFGRLRPLIAGLCQSKLFSTKLTNCHLPKYRILGETHRMLANRRSIWFYLKRLFLRCFLHEFARYRRLFLLR